MKIKLAEQINIYGESHALDELCEQITLKVRRRLWAILDSMPRKEIARQIRREQNNSQPIVLKSNLTLLM